jgi:hypothetical protein
LKRRKNAPLIAQIVVVAILFGALPMAASPAILQHNTAPAFTLNICTPLPSFTYGATSCSLPTMNVFVFECALEDRGIAIELTPRIIGRAIEAPDPPPPKSLI